MRLFKPADSKRHFGGVGIAILMQCAASLANGAVVYGGVQNIPVPSDFAGVYLNLDTGVTSAVEFSGWDINPFFGGYGIANSPAFQPARTGVANESALRAFGAGAQVNASLLFSSGNGGSSTHLGAGLNQFGIGQPAYLSFRFTTDGHAGPYFGWMRVVFTVNTPGGIIKDWAYETSGLATETGNVLQTAPIANVSSLTLSGGPTQDATLAPLPNGLGSGVSLAISKTGPGTWTLATQENYSSLAASDGLLNVGVEIANGTVSASGSGTVHFEVSQTLAALNIGSGGTVELAGFTGNAAPAALAARFDNPATAVPEPGCTTLIAAGAILLARSKHRR